MKGPLGFETRGEPFTKALADAFNCPSAKAAKTRLQKLIKQLMEDHSDAAASLKEGTKC